MHKVLIVEDEDIIRKGLMYLINWSQYNCVVVDSAENGEEGLGKIAQLQPDIVITDVRMPLLDGLKMLEKSKENHSFETIIISGHSEFEYAQKAISLGVSEYLLKPINNMELEKMLVKLTKKLEQKQEAELTLKSIDHIVKSNSILNLPHYLKESRNSTIVKNVIEYLEENYHNKISLVEMSDIFQISSVTLNSKFKEETNYTINDFLIRYRILKAIELLRAGELLIYEIANEVGFQDYKYFSQVFKKYVGLSPSDFLDTVG